MGRWSDRRVGDAIGGVHGIHHVGDGPDGLGAGEPVEEGVGSPIVGAGDQAGGVRIENAIELSMALYRYDRGEVALDT